MKNRGFSLLETVVGLSFLSLLAILSFDIFAWASTTFQLTSARLELQGEIRRIDAAVRRDMLTSAFVSVSSNPIFCNVTLPPGSANPSDTQTLSRDGVSFSSTYTPGDGDASVPHPQSYSQDYGFTLFNCTTIYYPITNPDDIYDCRLYRYKVSWADPDGTNGTTLQGPLTYDPLESVNHSTMLLGTFTGDGKNVQSVGHISDLSPYSLANHPSTLIQEIGVHCYSNRIRAFHITPNPGDQTLELDVTLQGALGHSSSGQRYAAEIVQASVLLKCENTWPKL